MHCEGSTVGTCEVENASVRSGRWPESMSVVYRFAWDPRKARANEAKHEVRLEAASEVFADPLAVTIFDAEHDED
jgi:hypothetical protein